MPDIVLTTLNARYIHAAFGLRYLLANLGPLRDRAHLLEFDIHQRPTDIAESLLSLNPKIIGIGIYIWNVGPATDLIAILKRVRPDLVVVVGGPEVSFEWEQQQAVALADHLITGEADVEFRKLCTALLDGSTHPPKVITATPPPFDELTLPYDLYTDDDIAHRVLYVEASRGCPFHCEFCLSSLEVPVRQAPLEAFLAAMDRLIKRGARHLKFVDRTFNLNVKISRAILEFCLERHQPGMLFHFEMIPDRLPEGLREVIVKFPAGALQFEVGIQTFNEAVAARISRRQDNAKAEANLRFLRNETGVHLHADLIAGLPGEDLESFADGFNRLAALNPQEIQVGILKRLRGTPIARHDPEWAMVYSPNPPYEILRNGLMGFETLQRLKRFARYWDLTSNSGNFVETSRVLLATDQTAFHAFLKWSDWLYRQTNRTDAIALTRLLELLWRYLTGETNRNPRATAECLLRDYHRAGRSDVPSALKMHVPVSDHTGRRSQSTSLKRQTRHLGQTRA